MTENNAQEKFPLEGVPPRHHLGAAAIGLLSLFLAGVTVMPPPRPAAAVPARVAVSTPTPGAVPSGSPQQPPPGSPSPSTPATPSGVPSPDGSGAPTPAPSGAPSPGPSGSPTGPDVELKKIEMIVDKMEHLNPALGDWTSDVAIEARVKLMMLVLPMDLHGRSYHKTPDKYKFELQNAPDLLKKYQQVFGYRPIVLNDFLATLLPDEDVNGRPNYVVRLDKKGDADFRSQTVWIDKENFTSPRRLYLYKDNGKIDVTFKWRKEKEYVVIDTMDAQLDFPKLNATATVKAKYQGYRFNTGLDDSIFVEKKVGNNGR